MNGVELIASERQRQMGEKGYSQEHDAQHDSEELALAAATYALPAKHRALVIWNRTLKELIWPRQWDFRGNTDRIRELQKAGALIAAELDRLMDAGQWDDWGNAKAQEAGQ